MTTAKSALNHLAVIYGSDACDMVQRLLTVLEIDKTIPPNKTVGIKPNLVVSKPSSSGATTDPEIVEGIIRYLHAHHIFDIVILESAWVGDDTERAFEVCGYLALQQKFGIRLLNVEKAPTLARTYNDLTIQVCKEALSLGFLINVPVLKAHSQTKLTCALKNMKGLIPASEKRRFHQLGLDKPIAVLNKLIRPNLTVVDGIIGDLSFEEGGNPVRMNRLFAGCDPVLIDAYAATLLGYKPTDIGHLRHAAAIGVGSMDLGKARIEELNRPTAKTADTTATHMAERYLQLIDQRQACSACVGSLIHGLKRVSESKRLHRTAGKIKIGQGFKERSGLGIGIGNCTRGLLKHLPGCPPSALDIRAFIEEELEMPEE